MTSKIDAAASPFTFDSLSNLSEIKDSSKKDTGESPQPKSLTSLLIHRKEQERLLSDEYGFNNNLDLNVQGDKLQLNSDIQELGLKDKLHTLNL